MEKKSRIFVVGSQTLIGSAIVRRLRETGFANLAGTGEAEPPAGDPAAADKFFREHRPEYVFQAGGRSGGIEANQKYPADLMLDNLLVEINTVRSAHQHGAKKLFYLASSCCYPRLAGQPMKVESLMTGPLEPTNEAYATAKIAGIRLCQAYRRQYGCQFISGIPANVFGPGDDFSLDNSHVVPAMLRKMHEAKAANAPSVTIWGTGMPVREFICADDLADAAIFAMQNYDGDEPINLGGGTSLSISRLAQLCARTVGYNGQLVYDPGKPDGMPRKALDSSVLLAMGWKPRYEMPRALSLTYEAWLKEKSSV